MTGAYNIGIFHWRPTEPAKRLAKDWKDLVLSDDKIWDQNAFNDLVHKVSGQPVQGEDELVYSYDGKLKLGVLPASIFCSGHTYFVQVGAFFFEVVTVLNANFYCYFIVILCSFFVLQHFSWHILFYHFVLSIHITNFYVYFS